MIKGYFLQDSTLFYTVIMDVPNLKNPPPFPDELEITDDENTVFFRRQRLYITALRDAIIEFLKDGMQHLFENNPDIFNIIKSYATTADAVDNESVVILRNLFKEKNADFISFLDVTKDKVGIAVKVENVKKEEAENTLSDVIDYVVQEINKENPSAKRPDLQERINRIMEESRSSEMTPGGLGVNGFPFPVDLPQEETEDTEEDDITNDSNSVRLRKHFFSVKNLLEELENEEDNADESDEPEEEVVTSNKQESKN